MSALTILSLLVIVVVVFFIAAAINFFDDLDQY
jgi:hypothetical protein